MIKKKSEQVEDLLYDMITSDIRFHLGDKLLNENDLSAELHVSRATLREAIRSLVVQGVLEVRRGKGTFIIGNIKRDGEDNLRKLQRMKLQLRELFEMRLVVEPETTFLAAQRANDEEIADIIRKGRYEEELIRSENLDPLNIKYEDWTGSDQLFHEAIVMASHNTFFYNLIPLVNRSISNAIKLAEKKGVQMEFTASDHALIMEFLERRDAIGAKHAMAMHIRHAMHALGFE